MLPEASLENRSSHGSAGRPKYGPKDKSKGNGLLWYRRDAMTPSAPGSFSECLKMELFPIRRVIRSACSATRPYKVHTVHA